MSFHNKISRRTFILFNLKIALFFLLISRLFYLQIFRKQRYQDLDKKNRISTRYITPQRGQIFDEEGVLLVKRKEYFSLGIKNPHKHNAQELSYKIGKILNRGDIAKTIYETMQNASANKLLEATLIHQLEWSEVVKIDQQLQFLPQIFIKKVASRNYLHIQTSHVVGYVGLVNTDEQKNYTQLQHIKEVLVGKTGIEHYYNNHLIGQCGKEVIEHNVKKEQRQLLNKQNSIAGQDINLTINLRLQNHITALFESNKGAAIVMELKTGNIVSLVSLPNFDANTILNKTDKDAYKAIFNNVDAPLLNRATQALYPPGSVFKIVTFLSALQNKISKNTYYECVGKIQLGKHIVHCNNRQGHGRINMKTALEQSCNCYTYYLAQEIGIQNILNTASHLNIFNKSGIDISYEKESLCEKYVKEKIENKDWRIGDTINFSIGQGLAGLTLIQMTGLVATIATNTFITPKINKDAINIENKNSNLDQDDLNFLRNILYNIVNTPKGTSYASRVDINGMQFAGKTGTAQLTKLMKNAKQQEKKHIDHSLFVGYGPYLNPRYCIGIIVENAGFGSMAAAPIASKIFTYLFKQH